MKKLLSLLVLCLSLTAFGQNMVTFKVDMAQYVGTFTQVNLNGTFNGWCGPCAVMTPVAPGSSIYTITLDLPAGPIEYKFTVDGWVGQENFAPGGDCTITTAGFTNRTYTVAATTALPTVCWQSCSACGVSSSSNVTFQVDMNQYTGSLVGAVVNLNGSFNGWCGGCAAMTDANNDGIYDIVVNLQHGAHEYKYTVNGWDISETFEPGGSCTMTTDIFTNRVITVSAPVTTPAYCWESCDVCMGDVCMAPTGMEVIEIDFGLANPKVSASWVNGEGTASCEVRGGRISDATAGTANPVFQNMTNTRIINQTNGSTVNFNIALYNNPNIPFTVAKTYGYEVRCDCSDGSGMSPWSGVSPGATFVVPSVPALIAGAADAKLLDAGMNSMNVFPNPADAMLQIQLELTEEGSVQVLISNALGQVLSQERMSGLYINRSIDVSTLEAGIYFLSVSTETGLITERVIIK